MKTRTQADSRQVTATRRLLNSDEGAALILALIFIVAILAMVPVALRMFTSDSARTVSYTDSRTNFYIAEAGLELAKSTILGASDITTLFKGPDGSSAAATDNGTIPNTGSVVALIGADGASHQYTQVSFNGGTYAVRIWDNDDGDSNLFADADGLVNIESIGAYNGKTKILQAMTSKFSLPPSQFPSAVTLVGATTMTTAQAAGFEVAGGNPFGVDINGNADSSCPGKNGIATESTGTPVSTTTSKGKVVPCPSTVATCVNISTSSAKEITGISGNQTDSTGNSIGSFTTGETSFTSTDSLKLWQTLTPVATSKYVGNTTLSGTATYGTATAPQVVYITGDGTLSGNISGTGVLIVDGNLSITGSLDWDGIILVGACTTCNGDLTGTGSANIKGAMVIGNAIDAGANFTGSATIEYSCQAINQANGVFSSTFKTASWNEVR
jgi:hypothetical protein